MPTALYVLIEDIVAVDGGGGQKYRRALRDRYLASPYFRHMLFEMNCFWGGGSIVWAAAITAIIFTTPRDVAFTVSHPFISTKAFWARADMVRFALGRMDRSIYMGGNLDFDHNSMGPSRSSKGEGSLE